MSEIVAAAAAAAAAVAVCDNVCLMMKLLSMAVHNNTIPRDDEARGRVKTDRNGIGKKESQ